MWEKTSKFFEEQSAIANFVQIAGAAIAIGLAAWRGARWVKARSQDRRQTTVTGWLNGRPHSPLTANALKVAVVDDRPEDYPLDALRRLGYSVSHIGHLGLAEVPSLLRYDCVLLDINGVLDEDPKGGGLQVLRRLKAADGPYVVAVSSRGFDITMSEFFMLADHRLKKPIPPAEVEGIIERAFASKFSGEQAARRIDEAASFGSSHTRATRKALYAARRYLEAGSGIEDVRKAFALIVPGERLQASLADLQVVRRSLTKPP